MSPGRRARAVKRAILAGLSVPMAAVACHAQSISPTLVVPETPPDTLPSRLLDTLDPEYGVPPDILFVSFLPGLTVQRKREILLSAGVVAVVGGIPGDNADLSDGFYVVRLSTQGDMDRLIRARDALLAQDGVMTAGLYTLLDPG